MPPASKSLGSALLLVVAAVVVTIAALGIHRLTADRDWSAGEPSATSDPVPSSLATLVAIKASSSLGEVVFLNDVKVERGPKPGIFIVRGTQGNRILVVADDLQETSGFSNADVRGQIRKLPSVPTLRKEWRLSKEQAHEFADDQIYIAAEYVKPQAE
jgi:hypothetical protein